MTMRPALASIGMVALVVAVLALFGASTQAIALVFAGGGALLIVCLLACRSVYDDPE
jgi:predicted lysophospholipase L1 biosynthesis ABC-type transport system permease subunit